MDNTKGNLCSSESEQVLKIVVFILTAVIVLLSAVILMLWFYYKRATRRFYSIAGELFKDARSNKDFLASLNIKFPGHFEIPRNEIRIEEVIGIGQFGVVHKGILSKQLTVAVKIPRSEYDREQFKTTLSEFKMLCYIGRHPNIVSFLGAYTQEIVRGKLYIVTEYCANGSLQSYLRKNQNLQYSNLKASNVDLYQLYAFSYQIACGMKYVAEKRVVHGDLATRNVLLTSEYTCKVADFGLSRRLYEMNECTKVGSEPIPWRWMALETLKNRVFTTKSDVWSYGVTLWEIFSLGMEPFSGKSWTDEFVKELENGMRMGKAQLASDEMYDCHGKMLDCWNPNQDKRPAFSDLKQYFAELRSREYINL